jgi:hypothetical protein
MIQSHLVSAAANVPYPDDFVGGYESPIELIIPFSRVFYWISPHSKHYQLLLEYFYLDKWPRKERRERKGRMLDQNQ